MAAELSVASSVALSSAEDSEAVALPSAEDVEGPVVDAVLPSAAVEDGEAVFTSGSVEASCSDSAARSSVELRGDGSSGCASSWLKLVPKRVSKAAVFFSLLAEAGVGAAAASRWAASAARARPRGPSVWRGCPEARRSRSI